MPKFKVLRQVDAYVNYTAIVEATSVVEAAELARANEDEYRWTQDSVSEFDARAFVTLDPKGYEIGRTRCGDG